MSFFRKLERSLQPLAIPHVLLAIVAGQTFFYLAMMIGLVDPTRLILVWDLVAKGELWRLASFALVPPAVNVVFIALALYLLYFIGNAVEAEWGTLRLNLFLLTGWALTVGTAWLVPEAVVGNGFIGGSVFLAFAYLNPNYVLYVLFVIPVRVKWLALITWLFFGYTLVAGDPVARLLALASTGNFLLFFGPTLIRDLKSGKRRVAGQLRRQAERRETQAAGPRHRCVVCSKNSDTHPHEDFRYCSKCAGDQCYCEEHLRNHVHVAPPQ